MAYIYVTLGSKANGYVYGTLYYKVKDADKKVTVTLEKLEVSNWRWKTDSEKNYQASFSVSWDGSSWYSRSGSWPNSDNPKKDSKKTTIPINQSKTIDKTDVNSTHKLRITGTHDVTERYDEATIAVKALAAKYLTPTWKVTGLTLERSGEKFTAKWKTPSAATNSNNVNRFTGIEVVFWANFTDKALNQVESYDKGASTTEQAITWSGIKRPRSKLYPNGLVAESVQVFVTGYHKVGNKKHMGETASATYSFSKPKKPSVAIDFDPTNKHTTITVESDEGKGKGERLDTLIAYTVTTKIGKNLSLGMATTKKTSHATKFDISGYLSGMQSGQAVTVSCVAVARGVAGPSESVAKKRVVAMPGVPSIKSISCTSKKQGGKVAVVVKTGKNTDQIQLERSHDAGNTVETVDGAVDDGDCKALYDSFGDVWPGGLQGTGGKVHYRLKATSDGYTVYSAWKQAADLSDPKVVPTASAKLYAPEVIPAADGASASVTMRWKDSTDNQGIELSWSDDKDAWKSGSGPNSETYDRELSSKEGSETVALTGLTSGTKYWAKTRRYRYVDDDGKTVRLPIPEGTNVTRVFTGYSAATAFVAETAADDKCGVISASTKFVAATQSAAARVDAIVTVGYTEDKANTGTELSWSTDEAAWTSSDAELQTQTYDAAGSKSTDKNYSKQVTLTITGLTPGVTYYVKARRYLDPEGGERTYTPYQKKATKVVAEGSADDTCKVWSATSTADGTGATVVVHIDEDNDNTGTEIAWSSDQNARQSNQQPESMKATWGTSANAESDKSKYPKAQTSYLRGLTPGTKYYIWARRYLETGEGSQDGPWSATYSFSTKSPAVDTAANDKCGIVSATVTGDGTSATLVIGWTEDNANDGTEISWSTDSGAWQANEGPQTMQATWADGKSKSSAWKATQTVYLRGLELGKTYYVKARRYLSEDGSYTAYSATQSLRTPTVRDDPDVRCGIVSLEQVNGTTARLVVGWSGDRTGCEATWSEDQNAWESSEGPQSTTFEWADEARQSSAWANTGTLYIAGLTEGTRYYVKARTWYDGDEQAWSDYTEESTITCVTAPASVTLAGPDAIARGESIELYWTVAHDLDQTEWHVHEADWDETTGQWTTGNARKALSNGTGSLAHASVPASRYGASKQMALYVSAGCGGELTDSNVIVVGIADVPKCEASTDTTVTAKPFTAYAYTDDPTSRLFVTLRSRGVTFQAPDGDRDQLDGDVVWTQAMTPAWTSTTWGNTQLRAQLADAVDAAQDAYDEAAQGIDADATANALAALTAAQAALAAHPASGACHVAAFEVPESAELVDGGTYELALSTVERTAGLSSAVATCAATVGWLHQAPAPSDGIELVPNVAERSVQVTLAEPDGWAETDVYDLYRMTPTGHVLVADNLAADAEVDDPYAPFGYADLHYRVAVRTADGDVAYDDYGYDMDVRTLRFDWGNDHVELPFNVEVSESYEKTFEARGHVDGSVNGYYDKPVTHTGSYDVAVMKADAETIGALRRLAEHPGAVFCRTGRGEAFQCNADLGSLDLTYATGLVGARFPITEMKLTRQFMARKEEGE